MMMMIEQRLLPDCMMPDGGECCIGHRQAEDEIARLRSENQIHAQEYAALLGLWKEAQERLEKAESVIAAVKALQFSPYPAHGSGWVEIVCEPEPGRFQRALAQYDSHAEQKETT